MLQENNYSDSEREHIADLASAYALGALWGDDEALQEIETHIESGDPVLAASLEQMLEASMVFAMAAPQVSTPASVRTALLESVEKLKTSTNGKATKAQYDDLRKPNPSQDALRLKKRTRYFIATSILSGFLLCTLIAMNISKAAKLDRSNDLMKALLHQIDSLRDTRGITSPAAENDPLVETAAPLSTTSDVDHFFAMFAAPDAHLVTLVSSPSGAARQHLIFSPKQKTISVMREKLRPLAAGQTYELWATVGENSPIAIGTFNVGSKNDPPVYTFSTKLKNVDSFAISIEKGNGGGTRNGKLIFVGNMPKTGIN